MNTMMSYLKQQESKCTKWTIKTLNILILRHFHEVNTYMSDLLSMYESYGRGSIRQDRSGYLSGQAAEEGRVPGEWGEALFDGVHAGSSRPPHPSLWLVGRNQRRHHIKAGVEAVGATVLSDWGRQYKASTVLA